MNLRNAIFDRLAPLFALLVLLLNLAACDVLDGNEPDQGDNGGATPPPLVEMPDTDGPTGPTGPDAPDDPSPDPDLGPMVFWIEAGNRTGPPGRVEQVVVECVARSGNELLEVEIWTAHGQVHRALHEEKVEGLNEGPWTVYRYTVELVIQSPDFVYVACTDTNEVKESRRIDFHASPPPPWFAIVGPIIRTNEAAAIPLDGPYYNGTFEVIQQTNVSSARVENDSLHVTSRATHGSYNVVLRATTPFGYGELRVHGAIHQREKLTTWANTDVELTFRDANGSVVHRMDMEDGVSAVFADPALMRAVHVDIRSHSGAHFHASRPFVYPDYGQGFVLNAYLVPLEPCRRFSEAWGRSVVECRELVASTLFADGYTRYRHAPEALVAASSPVTGDPLPSEWAAMFEEVRSAMVQRDVYMDRRPGSRNVWASQLKDQAGVLVPAEQDRILVLPDAQAMKPTLDYARDARGYTTGALLTLPVSRFHDNFRLALEDLLVRAWYPYTDSGRLKLLPAVEQRHFVETVIVPLRAAEDGVIGLSPGDRAKDVLIMP